MDTYVDNKLHTSRRGRTCVLLDDRCRYTSLEKTANDILTENDLTIDDHAQTTFHQGGCGSRTPLDRHLPGSLDSFHERPKVVEKVANFVLHKASLPKNEDKSLLRSETFNAGLSAHDIGGCGHKICKKPHRLCDFATLQEFSGNTKIDH